MEDKKIPIVAAMAVAYGMSYKESLAKYNSFSEQEKIDTEEMYLDNNMGFGPEAWKAYCDAKRELGEGRGHPR